MPFGKYKGQAIGYIVKSDSNYAKWCSENLEPGKIRAFFIHELGKLSNAPAQIP